MKPWQEEIKRMLASGLEYELDALANKDFRSLTKTHLTRKLKEEDSFDEVRHQVVHQALEVAVGWPQEDH